MSQDHTLIHHLLFLRFGDITDLNSLSPKLNYTSISKLTKVPLGSVRSLIASGLQSLKSGTPIEAMYRSKVS